MNKKKRNILIIVLIVIILGVLIFLLSIVYDISFALTTGKETITVEEKWVKYHGEDAKYLVSSTNGQVFQITDTFWKWRWNSSNLYAQLEPDKEYAIVTQGWRFPFFSDYKNILEANKK